VRGLISFADPAGNRLEAFHDGQIADEPFRPGRNISSFRAGPLGMGHVLLVVPQIDTALATLSARRLPRISCTSIRVITVWRWFKAPKAPCTT